MQKIFRFLAIGCSFCWIACLAQETLVKNPGFEGGLSTNGLPGGGWWVFDGTGELKVKVDRTVAFQGQASAQLRAGADAKSVLVSPAFAVAPGDVMKLEAHARGEN